jgi:hypothetical protein
MSTVKVGCTLPHGLIAELGYKIDPKTAQVTRQSTYQRVRLNGTNSNLIKGAAATAQQAPGITIVDEGFITEWLKANKNLGFVKGKMIYIIASDAEGAAIAIDKKSQKTGFEPLDPSKVPVDSTGKPLIGKMTPDDK